MPVEVLPELIMQHFSAQATTFFPYETSEQRNGTSRYFLAEVDAQGRVIMLCCCIKASIAQLYSIADCCMAICRMLSLVNMRFLSKLGNADWAFPMGSIL